MWIKSYTNMRIIISFLLLLALGCKQKPFEPQFTNDTILANACKYIYQDSSSNKIKSYIPSIDVAFAPQAVNGNFAFVLKEKETKRYMLVIRGTLLRLDKEGFFNIFQDANVVNMKNLPDDTTQNTKVSSGTYEGFSNVLKLYDEKQGINLSKFIDSIYNDKESTLVITGHSLGGNIANLLALHFSKTWGSRMNLVTFGAPATGNDSFVAKLEAAYPNGKRYVFDNDIATYYPDLKLFWKQAATIGISKESIAKQLNIEQNSNYKLLLSIGMEALDLLANEIPEGVYKQSELHKKVLVYTGTTSTSADPFLRAYDFHAIDNYIKYLK